MKSPKKYARKPITISPVGMVAGEIDLRQRAAEGMGLAGRLKNVEGAIVQFENDLLENLDKADAAANSMKATIDAYIADNNIDAPPPPPTATVSVPAGVKSLDCERAGVSTVIWSTGFNSNFRWIDVPVFNGEGYPVHERGVTSAEGLYFLGLPWLLYLGLRTHVGDCSGCSLHRRLHCGEEQGTEGKRRKFAQYDGTRVVNLFM